MGVNLQHNKAASADSIWQKIFKWPGTGTLDLILLQGSLKRQADWGWYWTNPDDLPYDDDVELAATLIRTMSWDSINANSRDVPNRYDLPEWSCVNKEIQKTNFEVKEIVKIYNNVRLVEASNAGRELFTRNGMHFNIKGKRWLAQEIINVMNRKIVSNPAEVTTDSEITLNLRDKEEELTK
ncbi:hypothetical protein J6590_005364 [Homalodisca vitripennis]|nr:hypothetical protein J6590_005364 [Homalodisca vitripennis]